jgi:hypothetical protein
LLQGDRHRGTTQGSMPRKGRKVGAVDVSGQILPMIRDPVRFGIVERFVSIAISAHRVEVATHRLGIAAARKGAVLRCLRCYAANPAGPTCLQAQPFPERTALVALD